MIGSNDIVLDVEGLHIRNSEGDVLQHSGSTSSLKDTATGDKMSGHFDNQYELVVIVRRPVRIYLVLHFLVGHIFYNTISAHPILHYLRSTYYLSAPHLIQYSNHLIYFSMASRSDGHDLFDCMS